MADWLKERTKKGELGRIQSNTPLVMQKFSFNKKEDIVDIPIEKLSSFVNKKGKRQPFKIRKDKVNQLASSIKDIGITTPLLVRQIGINEYQILSGHHRYEAAKKLNMTAVPCVVRNISDEEADKYVAECNIQRVKWYPSEYGEVFARYADMRKDLDLTIQEIADKFGVSRTHYYRYLNVSKCIPEVQEKIDQDYIWVQCADILFSLPEDKQKTIAEMATEENIITESVLNEYLGRKNSVEITDIPEDTTENEIEEVTTTLPISEDTEEDISSENDETILDTETEIVTEKEPVVKREKTQEEIERERKRNGEDIEVSFQYKKDFYNRLNKETEYGLATVCRTDEEVEEYIIKLVRDALNNSNKEVEDCISKLIDDALNF